MFIFSTLLLPALVALALCLHLGYAWATLALPHALRPYRGLLVPIVGLALLLIVVAALTTTTALTPPTIVAGLALLALPLNGWVLLRRTTNDERRMTDDEREDAKAVVGSWLSPGHLVIVSSCLLFILAVLPAARSGISAPLGKNWDAADFYVPLGRMLQLVSQRDLATLPRNPLVGVVTDAPVSGRVHAFSYLHAAVSSATRSEPLTTFVPLMAFLLAVCPLAVFPLGRVVGLGRGASLLMTLLVALAWLPLWVAYNSFANHLLALPLLWFALAASVVAVRDGGRAALATGALSVAALATGYYPAISAYVLLFIPVTVALGVKGQGSEVKDARFVVRRSSFVARLLLLGVLAFALSLPAQYYFFLKDGFLDEALKSGIGYRIDSYIGSADALGVTATLRGEGVTWPVWLVVVGVAVALLLGLVALLGRRAPLLTALACGAAMYQALMAWRGYYYGFYKGVTFELPVYAGLIAAGVWTIHSRLQMLASKRYFVILSSCRPVSLLLLVALNAVTIYRVQANYSATGPRLWSADELAAVGLHDALPTGASVLLVPADERAPTFNSLLSYTLLGNQMFGKFSTAYGTLSSRPKATVPDFALLPAHTDPASYGFQSSDLDWASAGMRLYHKANGLRYHRALGEGGRYPAIAPGASLALRLGADSIALPKESKPSKTPAEAQLRLAAASFGPATLTIDGAGTTSAYDLSGGLVEFGTPPLQLPATVEIHNTGSEPIYVWWGELHDPATTYDLRTRDEAFVQIVPQSNAGDEPHVAADLRVHTLALPSGTQQLTGLLTIMRNNQRAGQWVFFPDSGTFRLDADLLRLAATLTKAGQPVALHGSAQATGDGDYAATLALANDGQVIYSATPWRWRVRGDVASKVSTDTVIFDVLALPRPATPLDATTSDGALRLRGYTFARSSVRAGEALPIDLVWQSLRPIGGDLRARVTLRDASGRSLAQQTLPLGAQQHGTSAWQVGELSDIAFTLALPRDAPTGQATLLLEVLDASGHASAFADGTPRIALVSVMVE